MFAVLGHVTWMDEALPYAGPIARSKNSAIDAWAQFAIKNGEIGEEVLNAAGQLKVNNANTLVRLYGGDEVVTVSQLHLAS